MTSEELAAIEAQQSAYERWYWMTTDYDSAVNAEIRKRYTPSQEFAILRQRYEKLDEYEAYYNYCEECKQYVKEKQILYGA